MAGSECTMTRRKLSNESSATNSGMNPLNEGCWFGQYRSARSKSISNARPCSSTITLLTPVMSQPPDNAFSTRFTASWSKTSSRLPGSSSHQSLCVLPGTRSLSTASWPGAAVRSPPYSTTVSTSTKRILGASPPSNRN
ncbi:hypothetical protein GCM10023321_50400 [Pseudonocardia eucalypti]|uniref:Uncharacterized protein n=1 Tax=Pseudonocardia eucalypti TaxID=648755 RepID=A0ABP9QKF8_9PSEU